MVMHWWKTRNPGWRISMPVNAVGACITLIVLLVVAVTKFTEGAWVVIILIPIIIMLFLSIKKHYGKVSREISLISENENELLNESDLINYIVIPISDITKASLKAVNFINTLAGPKHKKVIIDAVHITDDVEEGHKLQERWAKLKTGIPLRLIESPYRRLIRPLIHYIDAIERKYKQKNILITVIVPEVVSDKWWQLLYRTNTAFLLKSALLFHRRTIVLSFPYHLTDDK
jgi:hypothetical protein